MTLYVDEKFIGLVSPQLQQFKRKKENLYNFRCPVCGDSKKNKTKARGYFYVRQNQYFFSCHNCSVCLSLANFLKDQAPHLYNEYVVERYKQGSDKKNTPKPKFKFTKPQFPSVAAALQDVVPLTKLPEDHPAVQFMIRRRFPKKAYRLLYYTDDFASWAQLLDPEKENLVQDEERLIIPFFNREGELFAAQGRSLRPEVTGELRYITIKADRSEDSSRRWYGLERHDPIKPTFVVEGPFDTFFLDNAIAMGGAGAFPSLPDGVRKEDSVIVYDNEPRNKEICSYMHQMLKRGFFVCIWPDKMASKDINDMILAGLSKKDIQRTIEENTYAGLAGLTRMTEWGRSR